MTEIPSLEQTARIEKGKQAKPACAASRETHVCSGLEPSFCITGSVLWLTDRRSAGGGPEKKDF